MSSEWPWSQDPKFPQEGKDTQLGAGQASEKEEEPHTGVLIKTLATEKGVGAKENNIGTVMNLNKTSLNLPSEAGTSSELPKSIFLYIDSESMTFSCSNLLQSTAPKEATDYKTINFQYH